MRKIVLMALLATAPAFGQGGDAAAAKATALMASSVMTAWPNGVVKTTGRPGQWGYEEGVLLDGIAAVWRQSGNAEDFRYIKASVDKYVTKDGTIQMDAAGKVFGGEEHQLDWIELGRAVMVVYRETHDERYAKAAKFLIDQLAQQPRTPSGAYWHKQIYPNQVWLDGVYMAEPFRSAYAVTFKQPGDFDDIAREFLLIDQHMRDPKTGLLKHGWDESKQMAWADKTTGLSPEVWGRAMGWYCMALVDVLDWIPEGNPNRAKLIDVLKRTMAAVVKYQDADSGVWWQVVDRGGEPKNFLEASVSCMFVDALAKGVQKGYLPQAYAASARKGWDGIQKRFVKANPDGTVTLTGTVKVGGLGGKPYRSGSYEYYTTTEALGENDAKGVGAYLMAGASVAQMAKR